VNDQVGKRLRRTLEQQADSVVEGPRFVAEDIVRAGRAVTRRRRAAKVWTAVAAAASLAVLVIVAPGVVKAALHQGNPVPVASRSAPPPRGLPANCPVERLPVPAHSVMDMVTGMDSTGRYIVGRTNPGGKDARMDMLLWDNGTLRVVALPGDQQLPTAVNSSGVAVGVSGMYNEQAWVYRAGTATYLQGSRPTHANAINDAGVIVGTEDFTRPVVWRTASSQPQALPTPPGVWEGTAADIDDDGTIVGTLHRQYTTLDRAYVWLPDGQLRELPLPVIDGTEAVKTRARSIAGDWVAGTAQGPTGDVATRWNLRTGDIQTFPVLRFPGSGISADGWLVGNDNHGQAVLATHPDSLTLPDLNNHNNLMANLAVTISDDGHLIAGDGSAGGALPEPVIWRCH
jgi:uncharacterized membrane protein